MRCESVRIRLMYGEERLIVGEAHVKTIPVLVPNDEPGMEGTVWEIDGCLVGIRQSTPQPVPHPIWGDAATYAP